MLTVVHELVRTARCAPQRDIFYQLKSDSLFATPRHVAEAIEVCYPIVPELAGMINVSRYSIIEMLKFCPVLLITIV